MSLHDDVKDAFAECVKLRAEVARLTREAAEYHKLRSVLSTQKEQDAKHLELLARAEAAEAEVVRLRAELGKRVVAGLRAALGKGESRG